MAVTSGIPVKSGYYLNPRRFSFSHVATDGAALQGAAGDRWVRVPAPVLIALAPLIGGLFVVAFPIVGAATLVVGVARKLAGGVKEGAADLAANLVPGPLPGEAHLTGKPGEAKEGAEAKAEPALADLEKEIGEKRGK
jgi:hypothetical protein